MFGNIIVDVKMIDIGHMEPLPLSSKYDVGYVKGLKEMIKLLRKLRGTSKERPKTASPTKMSRKVTVT